MPSPLVFVGGGAALTAAARAADKANGGGGPFRRLGEGRGAALREAWPVEALHTVPAARRAAAGDADELFAYARPPTSKAKREAGERRALQHQEWADAPKEKRQRAAEERAAVQAALLAPLAAADTTASLGDSRMRRPSAIVAAVLHQPIAAPAERAASMLAPLGHNLRMQCGEVLKRWREFKGEMNRSDEDGGDAVMRASWANGMQDGEGRPHTMPSPLVFVGGGAALTAAARAADKANGGGGPFRRLGEGRGAALREAWPVEALHTVPAARRAAAGDAEELFAYAQKRQRAAEEQAAAQAALLAPLAAADTTASLRDSRMRRPSAIVAAVLHQPIAAPAERGAASMLAPLGHNLRMQCGEVLKRWREFKGEMNRSDEDGGDAVMRASWANGMQDGYPCQQLTVMFLQYLLTSRIRQSLASWRLQRELGRGANTVRVHFKNMQNHVWPILFGPAGFPSGQDARAYWRPIRDQFSSLVGGGRGSGGVEQLASVAQTAASAVQVAAGLPTHTPLLPLFNASGLTADASSRLERLANKTWLQEDGGESEEDSDEFGAMDDD
ncbi:hypothetical protein EMIHUDRAFT_110377 [Emiliania huxleyi CCMP1516]|uniref:Uncharacterized protein n=2 Tax=Emiliania huxleyi TaxID=2903 RepID=A0A0D3KK44_EMIH1|nr:hypothetical protein EMIHUDRAFT_110377 [Emiliania huxleyi CCMP1516]EOD36129.1 hypothetical protein EMIHUDRAFT_110377 [Emiliania huxleyi CCMP1516]|eukprot:XP_005788558.1 hypothetical protein EMIHUDRAFT_110377 [Emiliania huxleyi CCMP1516]